MDLLQAGKLIFIEIAMNMAETDLYSLRATCKTWRIFLNSLARTNRDFQEKFPMFCKHLQKVDGRTDYYIITSSTLPFSTMMYTSYKKHYMSSIIIWYNRLQQLKREAEELSTLASTFTNERQKTLYKLINGIKQHNEENPIIAVTDRYLLANIIGGIINTFIMLASVIGLCCSIKFPCDLDAIYIMLSSVGIVVSLIIIAVTLTINFHRKPNKIANFLDATINNLAPELLGLYRIILAEYADKLKDNACLNITSPRNIRGLLNGLELLLSSSSREESGITVEINEVMQLIDKFINVAHFSSHSSDVNFPYPVELGLHRKGQPSLAYIQGRYEQACKKIAELKQQHQVAIVTLTSESPDVSQSFNTADKQYRLAKELYSTYGHQYYSFEAFKLYSKAARGGDARAQFELGWIFQHGYHDKKDMLPDREEAKRLYELSALQNYPPAQSALSAMQGSAQEKFKLRQSFAEQRV